MKSFEQESIKKYQTAVINGNVLLKNQFKRIEQESIEK